jgi:predicted nucleic acid-binding protein
VLRQKIAASIDEILRDQVVIVPVHFDAEVFAAIRKFLLRGSINIDEAQLALFLLRGIRVRRAAIKPLIAEAFTIRDRFSPYDAFYAIVARLSEATLLTSDRGLARTAKGYCKVEYVAPLLRP